VVCSGTSERLKAVAFYFSLFLFLLSQCDHGNIDSKCVVSVRHIFALLRADILLFANIYSRLHFDKSEPLGKSGSSQTAVMVLVLCICTRTSCCRYKKIQAT